MTELELIRFTNVSPSFMADAREKFIPLEYLSPRQYTNACRYKNLRRIQNPDDNKIYLENWNQKIVDASEGDEYYTVAIEDKNRLDMISNYYYNTPRFWWVIALANYILDPFDVPVGTVLRIPPITALYREGGVLSGN